MIGHEVGCYFANPVCSLTDYYDGTDDSILSLLVLLQRLQTLEISDVAHGALNCIGNVFQIVLDTLPMRHYGSAC